MPFWKWSLNPSANGTADPAINYAEGCAPSALNDSGRALMTVLAQYRDDTSGLLTTAGTATAYTVATNSGLPTIPNDGQLISFTPHATNGLAPTLTADGGTTYPIQTSPGVAVSLGSLVQGTPYTAKFSLSNLAWMLFGFYANPFIIPLASGMDYWGSAVPNSNFAFPAGQAISRTTYAALFALIGITYGGGDGSTTFNLPDKTGRISAMKEASQSRLTPTYFGGNSTVLGAVGGLESHTLSLAEMPIHSHGVSDPGHTHLGGQGSSAGSGPGAVQSTTTTAFTQAVTSVGTGISIQNAGAGNAHAIVQPTIISNYIMRILIVLLTLHAALPVFKGFIA